MKKYGMRVDKTSFLKLIHLFERDCSGYVQDADLGWAALLGLIIRPFKKRETNMNISQIERLETTLKMTPRSGAGTNSVARMQSLYCSWGVTISRRTIIRDFSRLEAARKIVFVSYAGTAKLFSRQNSREVSISPQLAWVLIKLKKNIEQLCTSELMRQIEPELKDAENQFNEKLRLDPLGKLNLYARKMEQVSHMLCNTEIPAHIIGPIKEAIYADDNSVVSVKAENYSTANQLYAVNLQILDNVLFLRGKLLNRPGQSVSFRLDDIEMIELLPNLCFQDSQTRLKAV